MAKVLKSYTRLKQESKYANEEISKAENMLKEARKSSRWFVMAFALIGAIITGILFDKVFIIFGGIFGYAMAWKLRIYPFEENLHKNRKRYNNVIKGNIGEELFVHVLEDSLSDNFYIINDITIPAYEKTTTQIDHVVVSRSGIFCVETKYLKGRFYPHRDGWQWFPGGKYIKSKKIIKSPQKQSEYHADMLRKLINKNGVKVYVKPIVVLANSDCSWMGERGTGKCPVFYLEDLVRYFNRVLDEYSYHNDEEVRKIAESILSFDGGEKTIEGCNY